jgi:hypothetical protein
MIPERLTASFPQILTGRHFSIRDENIYQDSYLFARISQS